MRLITQARQLSAADADGIAQSQTPGGAGDLTLNGALVTDGVAQLGQQRRVGITSAGDVSGSSFTIEGTRDDGQEISETLGGPNATTVQTVLDFATVTRVSISNAAAAAVTVGTTAVGSALPVPLDQYVSPFNVSNGVEVNGVVDVTVQYTFADVYTEDPEKWNWFNHPDLTNVTVNADGTFISPVTACRLLTNSGSGEATLRTQQAGIT